MTFYAHLCKRKNIVSIYEVGIFIPDMLSNSLYHEMIYGKEYIKYNGGKIAPSA